MNNKLFIYFVKRYLLVICIVLMFVACFDDLAPIPCGGPAICSSPRVCIENQCVFACTNDDDCQNDLVCERQVCVSSKLAEVETEVIGDMSNFDLSISNDMLMQNDDDSMLQAGVESDMQVNDTPDM